MFWELLGPDVLQMPAPVSFPAMSSTATSTVVKTISSSLVALTSVLTKGKA